MQVISFKYTKADRSVSDRVLAVMVKPNTMYEGIDISELANDFQAMFVLEMNNAYEDYLAKVEAIKAEHDVVHSYRRFDPMKMTEVIREEI